MKLCLEEGCSSSSPVTRHPCNALVFPLSVHSGEQYLHPFPLGTRDKHISAESKQRGAYGNQKNIFISLRTP